MLVVEKLKEKIKPSLKIKKPIKIKNIGYETLEIDQIKKGTPFIDLFPINPETLKSITEDMSVNGFDVSQPVIIWKETNVLIDGHTRCEAAKKSGIKEVVVIYESFPDVDAALRYAYGLQFKRRNLTDADRFQFSQTYVNKVGHGVKKTGRKKNELAEILSVSIGTAQKYITVINRGSNKMKESVGSGLMTINGAYKSLLDKEKQASAKPLDKPRIANKVKDDFKIIKGGNKSNKKNEAVSIELSTIRETITEWKNNCVKDRTFIERLEGVRGVLPIDSKIRIEIEDLLRERLQNECV